MVTGTSPGYLPLLFSYSVYIACGAYSVEIESKVFPKMFNDFESIQNSTW
jgi:hypothetical protein